MPRRKFRGADDDLGWINREITDLKRQIRELRSAKTLQAAEIGKGGLTVKGTGGIKMVAPDGTVIFEVFCNSDNPDPAGNAQPSFRIFRNDGTLALSLEDPLPGQNGYHQILRVWDRAGHEIFAEDATAGEGIANPWLPFPLYLARYTDWPKTTSGTFEDIWTGQIAAKNPTLTLGAKYTSDDSATSGEVRFQINGTTVGTTQSVGFGIGTTYLASYQALPSGVHVNDFVTVTLQAHRTAGTGNICCTPFATTGSQSG
ncbi:MAG TPA: hypothetical protein VFH66_06670 [Mycobacteriales bacterium]|nr:hypothetical protein [Mycobacteriales bacterium]